MGRVGLAGVRGPPWGRVGAGVGTWLCPAGRGDPAGRGSAHPLIGGTTPIGGGFYLVPSRAAPGPVLPEPTEQGAPSGLRGRSVLGNV